MQITIDTNDPVEKVLSVLSVAFGVSLGVNSDGASAEVTPIAAAPVSARRAGRAPRRGAVAVAKTPRPARSPRRPAKPSGPADTALVRAWANERGLQVRSRGPIPKPVLEAYRASAGA